MLTERDIAIAEWVGRQGAVRAEHVMTRFSTGRTATYRRLHELIEFGSFAVGVCSTTTAAC
jgi:hypothetical protein